MLRHLKNWLTPASSSVLTSRPRRRAVGLVSPTSRSRRFRPEIEALECRLLLNGDGIGGTLATPDPHSGGNVTARVEGDTLKIYGDVNHNAIEITAGSRPDEFIVRGMEAYLLEAPDTLTTVNGQTEQSFSNVHGLVIELGAASTSHAVHLLGVTITGNLTVSSASLLLDDVNVSGDTSLGLGDGDNTMMIIHSSFAGHFDARANNAFFYINHNSFSQDAKFVTSDHGVTTFSFLDDNFGRNLSIDTDESPPTSTDDFYAIGMNTVTVVGNTSLHNGITDPGQRVYETTDGVVVENVIVPAGVDIHDSTFDGKFEFKEKFDPHVIRLNHAKFYDEVKIEPDGDFFGSRDHIGLEALVVTSSEFFGQVHVSSTRVIESLWFTESIFHGQVQLQTGRQKDGWNLFPGFEPPEQTLVAEVHLAGSAFHDDVEIKGSENRDNVFLERSSFYDKVDADLKQADDTMTVDKSHFFGDFHVNGGDGQNALMYRGHSTFDHGKNLENIADVPPTMTVGYPVEGSPPPVDTVGPRIVSRIAYRDHMHVTFNEAINPLSFGLEDVVMRGQGRNRIQVTGVAVIAGSDNHSFDITFQALPPGGYHIRIGPGIIDLAGNWMDQDGDGSNGERQDAFVFSDLIGPRILSAEPSYGKIHVTFNEAIDAATFTRQDVKLTDLNGKAVKIVRIDADPWSNGNEFDIIVNSFPKGGYKLTIGPNITDVVGNPMNQNDNGHNGEAVNDQYVATVSDRKAPVVVNMTATRAWSAITIDFNKPIDVSTLTSADVTIVNTGTGQTVPVWAVDVVAGSDSKSFEIRFQGNPGTYQLTLGRQVFDIFGNRMAAAFKGTFVLQAGDVRDQRPPKDVYLHPLTQDQLRGLDPIDPMDRAMLLALAQDVAIFNNPGVSVADKLSALQWPMPSMATANAMLKTLTGIADTGINPKAMDELWFELKGLGKEVK